MEKSYKMQQIPIFILDRKNKALYSRVLVNEKVKASIPKPQTLGSRYTASPTVKFLDVCTQNPAFPMKAMHSN